MPVSQNARGKTTKTRVSARQGQAHPQRCIETHRHTQRHTESHRETHLLRYALHLPTLPVALGASAPRSFASARRSSARRRNTSPPSRVTDILLYDGLTAWLRGTQRRGSGGEEETGVVRQTERKLGGEGWKIFPRLTPSSVHPRAHHTRPSTTRPSTRSGCCVVGGTGTRPARRTSWVPKHGRRTFVFPNAAAAARCCCCCSLLLLLLLAAGV